MTWLELGVEMMAERKRGNTPKSELPVTAYSAEKVIFWATIKP